MAEQRDRWFYAIDYSTLFLGSTFIPTYTAMIVLRY